MKKMEVKTMETKEWYTSRTIWSAIVLAIATILQRADIVAFSNEELGTIIDGVTALAQIIGLIGIVFYRCKASKSISSKKSGDSKNDDEGSN